MVLWIWEDETEPLADWDLALATRRRTQQKGGAAVGLPPLPFAPPSTNQAYQERRTLVKF